MAETILTEEWRDVVGYEGLYEVSDMGRVRDARGIMRQLYESIRKGKPSYIFVNLSGERQTTHTLHKLVAAAFIGPRPAPINGQRVEINHKDGVKSNCAALNLEYATRRENMEHAVRTGLMPTGDKHGSHTTPESVRRGEAHHNAKLSDEMVRAIRADVENAKNTHATRRSIGDKYGVSESLVYQVATRRIWAHVT